MGFKLKKLLKKIAPSPKKLTPKFVQKSEVLTKISSASIAHRAVRQNSAIAKAPDWKTSTVRPLLREQHELQTSPSSKTAEKIRVRDKMAQGPARDALTAEINASTLKRGHVGIAVGSLAVGGAAGSAVGAGGKALTASDNAAAGVARANRPVTDGRPGFFNEAETLPYDYNNPAPASMYGAAPGARPGIITSLVNFLFGLFVAPKPHVNNQSKVATAAAPSVPLPAASVGALVVPNQMTQTFVASDGNALQTKVLQPGETMYTIGNPKTGSYF